jgi:hypothetical protein
MLHQRAGWRCARVRKAAGLSRRRGFRCQEQYARSPPFTPLVRVDEDCAAPACLTDCLVYLCQSDAAQPRHFTQSVAIPVSALIASDCRNLPTLRKGKSCVTSSRHKRCGQCHTTAPGRLAILARLGIAQSPGASPEPEPDLLA